MCFPTEEKEMAPTLNDEPVSMTDMQYRERINVEDYLQATSSKTSDEEIGILQRSMFVTKMSSPVHIPGRRRRKHRLSPQSSFETKLQDIVEGEEKQMYQKKKDFAAIHQERAANSGQLRNDKDRIWRMKMHRREGRKD